MKRIFVTTDLSANSASAIRFALQHSSQSPAELYFYYCCQGQNPETSTDTEYKSRAKKLTESATEKLKRFVRVLSTTKGLNARYLTEMGEPAADMILKAARKHKADFICIGTHGAGGLKKFLGTTTSRLIKESPIPVIAVPKAWRRKPFHKIVYASDFSALTRELRAVKDIAKSLDTNLEIFNYDYLYHVPEVQRKLHRRAARHSSDRVSFHLRKQNIERPFYQDLLEEVKNNRPGMIVLFTKRDRNWFDSVFSASKSADLSFSTPVPLLVFKK